jgi:hypothetical protein
VRPYLKKNPSQKRASGVAQDVGPEFKPQYWKRKESSWAQGCMLFRMLEAEDHLSCWFKSGEGIDPVPKTKNRTASECQNIFYHFSFFFLVALEFKLRASHLLGRHFTILPALYHFS